MLEVSVAPRSGSQECQQSQGARLLADIGGTNARFGWQPSPEGRIEHAAVFPTAAFETITLAIRHYLDSFDLPRPAEAGIAIATAIESDCVQMTNHHWAFSIDALRRDLGVERISVVNDFQALAMAVPAIEGNQCITIKSGAAVLQSVRAVIGPGTGLGVASLVCTPDGWQAMPGEGGHVTLAPEDDEEYQVLSRIRDRFGHASAERVLSGSGLINLHEAIWGNKAAYGGDPALLLRAALSDSNPAAVKTLSMFCSLLGSVAANLALTVGARGGVYLAGGILPRMPGFLLSSAFTQRFLAKGRMGSYLAPIPVHLIDAGPTVALEGMASLLDRAERSEQ